MKETNVTIIDYGVIAHQHALHINNDYVIERSIFCCIIEETKNLNRGKVETQFAHFVNSLYSTIDGVKNAKQYSVNYTNQGIIEFGSVGITTYPNYNEAIGVVRYSGHKKMTKVLLQFSQKSKIRFSDTINLNQIRLHL